MLMIRLSRTGKKHRPHYKLVVCEKHSKRDGKNVALLGHWDPAQKKLVVDRNEYQNWLTKGAAASPTVRKLVNASNNA